MNQLSAKKIVVLGMMTKMPVAGIVYLTMQYVLGFKRLGYDVYYVEAHARTPSMFMDRARDDGSTRAASFIAVVMHRFGLDNHWAFHALHDDGRYFGMSRAQLEQLYESAELILNLHGGTEPLPEHSASGRLVYIGTDPVEIEIELYHDEQHAIEFLEPHCAFFTWGENYGKPDCPLPVSVRFPFKPTRQPILLDLWQTQEGSDAAELFTTIGNWQQPWRQVLFRGELYYWSKHYEFLKFIDLPQRTKQGFELALASCDEYDKELLVNKGWRVRDALHFTRELEPYRWYILHSRGEFTVAKDQNVRLRSGWFSDRSASYLAAGRPVITQETGFSNHLPTGAGLFSFSTMYEILDAVEAINANYAYHRRAALEIAREYFSYDRVLPRLLSDIGLEGLPRWHRQEPIINVPGYPLARPAMRAEVMADVPSKLSLNARVQVNGTVENLSTVPFVSLAPHPVHISYKWLDAQTGIRVPEIEGERAGFEEPLLPNESRSFQICVQAPPYAGDFILRMTLVQEHVAWFDDVDESNAYSQRVEIVKRG